MFSDYVIFEVGETLSFPSLPPALSPSRLVKRGGILVSGPTISTSISVFCVVIADLVLTRAVEGEWHRGSGIGECGFPSSKCTIFRPHLGVGIDGSFGLWMFHLS